MLTTQRLLLALLACYCYIAHAAPLDVKVDISGIDPQLEHNVRLFLSIEQQKDHALMSEGRLYRLHRKAPEEIRNALRPFGYYRPVIKSQLSQPSPSSWLASYQIDPGPPLRIAEFDFGLSEPMASDPEFQSLVKDFSLRKGDILVQPEYENIKASLAKLAAERGYFDARFSEHRVAIDLDSYEARIHLHYEGGPRYSFGDVQLNQNVLDDALLRRYIPFETGSPYTLNELIDLQQALHDSDYFQSVEVSPGDAEADSKQVPIKVTLTPRKPNRYSFGLGYGTDTGARTRFSWEKPRLNRKGHRFSTEARVSEIGYSLSAQYRVPVLNPRTDQMVYSAGVVNEKTDTSDSTIKTVGASLNRSRGEWRESIALNYQQEDYTLADVNDDSSLLMPGVNWSRTWGNNFIYTIDGLRFDLGLRGASDQLASDTSFLQWQGGLKAISAINDRNRFIARGRLGGIRTSSFNELPSSVRFFTGGAQSVRGYAYQSLGPVDADGKVIGGRYLMVGSIEYEHSFNGKWGVALFYDGGNALNNLRNDLERGAGIGLRWKSPVGPVRIDLASALSRDGQPWRIHINIGPDL